MNGETRKTREKRERRQRREATPKKKKIEVEETERTRIPEERHACMQADEEQWHMTQDIKKV